MFMNTIQEINQNDLQDFKVRVKQWLDIDEEIKKKENEIKEMKKLKNKTLEPEITSFMRTYNISDLNTDSGKLKCNERNTKKPLNKNNIRENLSQVIGDTVKLDQAMSLILTNREVVTTYKLTKPKR
jgi:predicted house-cleaning NTP pyrophosphatase (Maf/HAM1 superfamily)